MSGMRRPRRRTVSKGGRKSLACECFAGVGKINFITEKQKSKKKKKCRKYSKIEK